MSCWDELLFLSINGPQTRCSICVSHSVNPICSHSSNMSLILLHLLILTTDNT